MSDDIEKLTMEAWLETHSRLTKLEKQVEFLRTAIGLLSVSAQPTIDWLDKKFDALEE